MKKKVLFLTSSAHISGAENVILTIIKALRAEYEFAYATLGEGDIFSQLEKQDIKYYVMKKSNQASLNKILKQFQPDIIHANDFKASILLASSKYSGKKISHIHQCPPFIQTNNLKSWIYRWSIPKYNCVISVSDAFIQKSVFQKELDNKFRVIPNIIDVARIDAATSSIDTTSYDFAYFGRLEEDKNPLGFIDIIKEYKDLTHNSCKCIMVGDGSLKGLCQSKIKEYGLTDSIKMVGFLTNPFEEISKAKIVLMPSKNEGFGLTAVESMYLGIPVLSSGVGGLGEIFRNHLELICKDTAEYIEKIGDIFQNYEQYQKIAKEISSDYVDIETWANYFRTIYDA